MNRCLISFLTLFALHLMAAESVETVRTPDTRNELLFGSAGSVVVQQHEDPSAGLSFGYYAGLSPKLQFGLISSVFLPNMEFSNLSVSAFVGPAIHVPLNGYDYTVFLSAVGGVSHNRSFNSTRLGFNSAVGARLRMAQNINFRPNISATKFEDESWVFALNLISFSASF